MRVAPFVRSVVASTLLLLLPPSASAAIQLTPVVSGLSSPVFVGNAGDQTDRLFIVEQGGVVKVLQPGSSTPTVFLDIHTKILSGGERGLLGLAFHPLYEVNRRFFVFYTRSTDGALVIAEYHASVSDANVADAAETVLLTIPHPTNANHNGGMLAFGPDNYLYVGVGDGGSSNDPPNNAQNINVLLGKILRLDVDTPNGSIPYSAAPGNPFINANGADEIYSFGWRNPWRFSFDRTTGQQWVADVGQGAREEVDTPILVGGNYGWRVYEGNQCTNNDAALCNPANYIFPLFDYDHSAFRCSITGGYVYRGSNALPQGTYVFGDYCTGEIFTWDGARTLQLDTALNISSFGEDENGELYVVGLGGTISRIDGVQPPCNYDISPASRSVTSAATTGSVSVTADAGCRWDATANDTWLHVTSGFSGTGNGNVGYSVDANSGGTTRTGTFSIAGKTFTVTQGGVACTFSVSPTKPTAGAAGGAGSISVATAAGCQWTATSGASWITITGGTPGSGSGSVTYTVAPYSGKPKNRNGSMIVAGQTITLKQSR